MSHANEAPQIMNWNRPKVKYNHNVPMIQNDKSVGPMITTIKTMTGSEMGE